jgi:hypothetical protein
MVIIELRQTVMVCEASPALTGSVKSLVSGELRDVHARSGLYAKLWANERLLSAGKPDKSRRKVVKESDRISLCDVAKSKMHMQAELRRFSGATRHPRFLESAVAFNRSSKARCNFGPKSISWWITASTPESDMVGVRAVNRWPTYKLIIDGG